MKLPRIMIASASSGSGKTTVMCGLLEIFKRHMLKVSAFKCGPDYIDTMFHKNVLNTPSKNLDTFFTDADTTVALMAETACTADISVIEGVMGYYDGAGLNTLTASSYDVAHTTKTPVILILNTRGMSLSAIANIKGFIDYIPESRIRGVILNNTSKTVYEALKPIIENNLGIYALGYIPKLSESILESRHLGLITPDEIKDLNKKIEKLADILENTLDINKIIKLSNEAPNLNIKPFEIEALCKKGDIRIGIAMDNAFCFYYEDNLRLLEKLGASLIYFSPLTDACLPENLNGCILGGGYPELYLDELSSNKTMLKSMYNAYTNNHIPFMAECGGFLYLHETMEDLNNKTYPLVGSIQGSGIYTGHLSRFGYITLTPDNADSSVNTSSIKAHEFHYYDSTNNGNYFTASKPFRDISYKCMHKTNFSLVGFPHLYYYSNPKYAKNFVKSCINTLF